MRRKPQLSTVLLVLLCGLASLLSGSSTAFSQVAIETEPAAAPTAEPFFEAVHVEVVNIDVWVTDKQGRPVDGLAKDDFVVLRDGQPVEVTNFYAVAGGQPVSVSPDAAAPAPAPVVRDPRSRQPLVAPEHRLWLIVFIDNYNLDPIERDRVLPALETFLGRTLEADDQAMLVTYKRSLDVRQPFTDQLPLLRTALGTLRKESGLAVVRNRDRTDTLRQIDNASSGSQALTYARQYAEEQMNGVGYTMDALQELIDTLAGLPGRKALLHVSSGIPMLAGEEMFHAVAEKFGLTQAYSEIPRHDTTRRFETVIRRANEQRVTFHTMDAGGLRGMEFGAAEYAGFVDMDLRSTLDSVVPENLQSPLRLMANETGGRAILNRNEVLPALDEVAQDFRSFYSLGISSTDVDSGRYHRLEVKLRERPKGVRLRHRAGYRSKSLRHADSRELAVGAPLRASGEPSRRGAAPGRGPRTGRQRGLSAADPGARAASRKWCSCRRRPASTRRAWSCSSARSARTAGPRRSRTHRSACASPRSTSRRLAASRYSTVTSYC